MKSLDDSISIVRGVGEAKLKLLKKKGISSVRDAIRYYPRDYEDFTNLIDIDEANEGDEVCFVARVARLSQVNHANKKKPFTCVLIDDSSSIRATFYGQPYMNARLASGDKFLFHGTIKNGRYGNEIVNPDVEEFYDEDCLNLRAIYPLTKGLKQYMVRNMMREILHRYADLLPEFLPKQIMKKYSLCAGRFAYEKIHRADGYENLDLAKRRLKFEELFLVLYGLRTINIKKKSEFVFDAAKPKREIFNGLVNSLPYKLTDGQRAALKDVLSDLMSGYQMNRLLQGDVGSGKTIVAFLAMHFSSIYGFQSVLMAPTSVLAEQHYNNFKKLFPNISDEELALLTGKLSKKEKRDIYERIENGTIKFLIGTHAVLSEQVRFNNLALAITDEQHRFGVRQRLLLNRNNESERSESDSKDLSNDETNAADSEREKDSNSKLNFVRSSLFANNLEENNIKDNNPHILVMSATPIPRTLAMIIYGDLSVSWIIDCPKGRQKVETYTARNEKHDKQIIDIGKRQLEDGGALFYKCPTNEEEDSGIRYVEKTYEEVKSQYPEYKVGYLHGGMKEKKKQEIMGLFAEKQLDILVSTTVVEVGVDVPRANMIVILDAERYGMAQLHQLRGRVGRGELKSYCFLRTKLGPETLASKRLREVCVNNNGYELADIDMKLRGAGDFFGTRQHGIPEFKIANLYDDQEILAEAREAVESVLSNEISLSRDDKLAIENGLEFYFDNNDFASSI